MYPMNHWTAYNLYFQREQVKAAMQHIHMLKKDK
jgi:hypothetical protein